MLFIFRHVVKHEEGATAIEYTLIAALVALAAITALKLVGGGVSNVLNNVATNLQ